MPWHIERINTLLYCIISDEFAIDADSGVITVVGDLDEENIDMYILTVQAENDQATGAPPVTVRESHCQIIPVVHAGYMYSQLHHMGSLNQTCSGYYSLCTLYVEILGRGYVSTYLRGGKLLCSLPSK